MTELEQHLEETEEIVITIIIEEEGETKTGVTIDEEEAVKED